MKKYITYLEETTQLIGAFVTHLKLYEVIKEACIIEEKEQTGVAYKIKSDSGRGIWVNTLELDWEVVWL